MILFCFTHLFPMHPFSTPENIKKPYGFLMFPVAELSTCTEESVEHIEPFCENSFIDQYSLIG